MSVSLVAQPDDEELQAHLGMVARNLRKGRVTPVLGAAASLFGRRTPALPRPGPRGEDAAPDRADSPSPGWDGAPSARELAEYLVKEFDVTEIGAEDLIQVAQCVYALRGGSGDLYETLHSVFDNDFPATALHDFLARIPEALNEAKKGKPPLIVTTNYDDVVERALEAKEQPYDVVVYMAEGKHEGLFCHATPGGALEPITSPETYLAVDPDRQTVLLKMHGFVCRRDATEDSYVITEDHYIEYLTRTDLTKLLPKPVMARLLNCHLLFLGYSLRDWNFRAILHQIYLNRLHDNDWWAVLLNPSRLERRSWDKRHVALIPMALEDYIPALELAFEAELAPPPDGA